MATQSHVLILLLFISSLVSTLAIAPSPGLKTGGFHEIDVNDPRVQEVAKFAVTEHNRKANTDLVFKRVIKAEAQVVAGTNYRLIIAAKDGTAVKKYGAEVYDNIPDASLKLDYFKPLYGAV